MKAFSQTLLSVAVALLAVIKNLFIDRFFAHATVSALALASLGGAAQAANLVQNGDFEDLLVPGVASQFGDIFPSQQVIGWTTQGNSLNFVFTPGTADTTGAVGYFHGGPGDPTAPPFMLWGPDNGSPNGLPPTSPAGGNFLAMDGDPAVNPRPVTQVINGLTPGVPAVLTFYFAGGQQSGFDGPTTQQFSVSLGNETQFTPTLETEDHGFSPWRQETMTFLPTSSTETLSFLAMGTPSGEPPFVLLDFVHLETVPEPATWTLLVLSLTFLAVFKGMRRGRSATAAGVNQV